MSLFAKLAIGYAVVSAPIVLIGYATLAQLYVQGQVVHTIQTMLGH